MNILVTTHGGLVNGLLDAYELFFSSNSQIHGLSLSDGVDKFKEELSEKVESLLNVGDLLILTDLQGGSPYNESFNLMLQHPLRIKVVAGVNLPMLIEVGSNISTAADVGELADLAVDVGRMGVMCPEVIIDEEVDDEDLF